MFLQLLCEGDVVKVVKGINGGSETLVIFLLNEKSVECLIDGFIVVVLYSSQIWLHHRDVIHLRKHIDSSGVVQAWREYEEQVIEQQRFVVYVKLQCLVVELNIGYLCDNIFEVVFLPCIGGMVHHCNDSIVIFFILIIQKY